MKKPGKDAFALLGGAIAGAVVGKMAVKMIPIENNLIKALIPIGAGLFLSGSKGALMKGAGVGMAAAGGLTLIDALAPGMISGPDSTVDESIFLGEADSDYMLGPADQSILSGPADQSILSGPGDENNMAAQSIAASFEME